MSTDESNSGTVCTDLHFVYVSIVVHFWFNLRVRVNLFLQFAVSLAELLLLIVQHLRASPQLQGVAAELERTLLQNSLLPRVFRWNGQSVNATVNELVHQYSILLRCVSHTS
jgi:hypothetical protein